VREEDERKRLWLLEAVFGSKNVIIKSLKTDWGDDEFEIGLTDGESTLLVKVDFNNARFASKGSTDAA
jgi:hypothetical protein